MAESSPITSPAKKVAKRVLSFFSPRRTALATAAPQIAPEPAQPLPKIVVPNRTVIGPEHYVCMTTALLELLYSKAAGRVVQSGNCTLIATDSKDKYIKSKVTCTAADFRKTGMDPTSVLDNVQVRFHQLAAILHWRHVHGDDAIMQKLTEMAGTDKGPDQIEASHLCGNTHCVKIEHLWLETGPVNKSRDQCLGQVTFTCPGCSTAHTVCKCSHTPKCHKSTVI